MMHSAWLVVLAIAGRVENQASAGRDTVWVTRRLDDSTLQTATGWLTSISDYMRGIKSSMTCSARLSPPSSMIFERSRSQLRAWLDCRAAWPTAWVDILRERRPVGQGPAAPVPAGAKGAWREAWPGTVRGLSDSRTRCWLQRDAPLDPRKPPGGQRALCQERL